MRKAGVYFKESVIITETVPLVKNIVNMKCLSGRSTEVFSVFLQQKRPDSPLEPTNPFLEDEPGEDVGTEKDEDLAKVS